MAAARRSRRTPASASPRRPAYAGAAAAPNPSGAHVLADPTAAWLVRQADVRPGELVLDIGAGLGALTRPLLAAGARVVAIERDPRIAARLARRTAGAVGLTVVTGDALAVPLPRRPYRVVANIPFSITTPLLRRLVDSPLVAADLVVELAAGRRLASPAVAAARPELGRWHRRCEFSLGPVIPPHRFRPPPSVPAVVLRLRRVSGWRSSRRSGPARR